MLKQLIQWLLDSRTTPAQAAHSALRNTSSSTSIFTGEQIYTAPEDGFITVEGKSEANGGSAIGISSNGENYFLRTFQSVKDWGQAVTAPVSKGETVSISLYNLTDIEVKFYKSFGGGYNILVWRALSCLRPSFNFSQRSFFKVNIPTLLINADQVPVHKARQSQETARRISWLHSQVGLSLRLAQTVRQTTHGLGLKTPPEELHTFPMQFANTKRLLSQCKKEMFLLLTSALITRTKAPFCLSLLKQQNNLRTGGALC